MKLREQAARAAGRAGLGRLVDALVDGQVARLRKVRDCFLQPFLNVNEPTGKRAATHLLRPSRSAPLATCAGRDPLHCTPLGALPAAARLAGRRAPTESMRCLVGSMSLTCAFFPPSFLPQSLRSFIWRKRSSCSIKITAPDILQRVRTASERPRNRCVSPSSSDEEIDEAHARRQQSGDDSSDHTDVLEHADDAVPAPRKRARRIVPPRRYGDDADADTPHPAATTATEKYAFDSFSRPVTASSSDCSDSAAARTAAKPVSADVLARLSKLTVEANDIAMVRAFCRPTRLQQWAGTPRRICHPPLLPCAGRPLTPPLLPALPPQRVCPPQGRAAKDLCASIKGDGLTAARVSATHLAARALSELSRHADKVQTSANVSVFMREVRLELSRSQLFGRALAVAHRGRLHFCVRPSAAPMLISISSRCVPPGHADPPRRRRFRLVLRRLL